jgi:hypothetical protein
LKERAHDSPPYALVIASAAAPQILPKAWAALTAGESFCDPSLNAAHLPDTLPQFVAHLRRELGQPQFPVRSVQLLALLAQGYSYPAIAHELGADLHIVHQLTWRLRQQLSLADTKALRSWAKRWYTRACAGIASARDSERNLPSM